MSRFMQGSVRGRHYIREGIQFSTVIAELWAFKGTFSCLGVITLIYSEWEKGTHTRRVFGLIKPLITSLDMLTSLPSLNEVLSSPRR